MADVGLLRKRIRNEIDAARRAAATRRERAAAATRAYEQFLANVAIPAFRAMSTVLRAEGLQFETITPSGGVRLVSDRNRDDVIELELDTSVDPPQPLLITTQTRGSRILRTEKFVKEGSPIEDISEDALIELLIEQMKPWFG